MLKLGRHVLFAAGLLHTVAFADTSTEPASHVAAAAIPFAAHPSISSLPPVSTCRSKEINYITHTLPQQCLKSRPTTPPASSATVAPAAGAPGAASNATSSAAADHAQSFATGMQHPPSSSTTSEADGSSLTPSQSAAGSAQPSAGVSQGGASPSRSPGQPPSDAEVEGEAEADSPLDNANFLSFEEWKKQNLAKAGQSPENVGQGRGTAGAQGRKPRPVNINSELDFLGEDTEIELSFGFGKQADRGAAVSSSGDRAKASVADDASTELSQRPRSKDAGKTCKERFNYASFDCAATVLKTNPQCKSSSSLLVENKDSYMLNECAAENKFVIVELCEDILVDTIVLANFEFFSSMFRMFRVSVADRYPVKLERWKELGTFEARNSRDIQAFLVENPLIWARYLRIEFLTHYGNEFYCPVSLLRVHGTTMMEEFRHQEEAARGEEDLDDASEIESQALPAIQPYEQGAPPADAPAAALSKDAETAMPADAIPGEASDATKFESTNQTVDTNSTPDDRPTSEGSTTFSDRGVAEGSTNQTISQPTSTVTAESSPASIDPQTNNATRATHNQTDAEHPNRASTSADALRAETGGASSSSLNTTDTSPTASPDGEQKSSQTPSDGSTAPTNGTVTRSAPAEGSKSSTTQAQNAAPTTQESFFKSIHKRLQMLESNSTLSLQYIEDQSRILRDAFSKVEKRQLGKTEKFLDQLNSTVMAELREFRQQYDQLWQSTVIELENRREQHQREMLAISSRLTLLADELVFQKRMAVVQSTLILLCLGLVLFVRSGSSYLELPLVQQMMQKSQTALRLPFDSPSSSPPPSRYRRHAHSSSTEERKRFRFFGSSSGNMSDASTDGPRSPALEFSPPTPTSDVDMDIGSREQSPEPLRKTHSSPSTPRGFRDSSKLSWERGSEADVLRPLSGGVAGDGQTLMRRRSPLRSSENVNDVYEGEQNGQKGGGKAGGADPNHPGDSGGSASESDDCLGLM